jgi:hypothetical protein
LEDFEAVVGSSARIEHVGTTVQARLESAKASPYPSGRAAGGFSLLLSAPLQPALTQGIYSIEIDGLGSLELFLTPVAQNAELRSYEVVFN